MAHQLKSTTHRTMALKKRVKVVINVNYFFPSDCMVPLDISHHTKNGSQIHSFLLMDGNCYPTTDCLHVDG